MSEPRFPNESDRYRAARDALLEEELALRDQVERVAEQRRSLPPSGTLKEDYVFEELVDGAVTEMRLSELFAPDDTALFIYSFMFAPDMDAACPMCTSILDALDAQVTDIDQQISTAVVAKHDPETIAPQPIDRPVSRRRRDPTTRVGWEAIAGPHLERHREGLLNRVLGEIDVAEDADQGGYGATELGTEDRTDLGLLELGSGAAVSHEARRRDP
jgi:hypothetical protein